MLRDHGTPTHQRNAPACPVRRISDKPAQEKKKSSTSLETTFILSSDHRLRSTHLIDIPLPDLSTLREGDLEGQLLRPNKNMPYLPASSSMQGRIILVTCPRDRSFASRS